MEVKYDDLSLEIRKSLENKLENSSYSIKLVVEYEEPIPDDWTPNDVAEFMFLEKCSSTGLSPLSLCRFVAKKVAQLEKARCIKEFKHYIDQYVQDTARGEWILVEHLLSFLGVMENNNEFDYPRLKRDDD